MRYRQTDNRRTDGHHFVPLVQPLVQSAKNSVMADFLADSIMLVGLHGSVLENLYGLIGYPHAYQM